MLGNLPLPSWVRARVRKRYCRMSIMWIPNWIDDPGYLSPRTTFE